MLGLFIETLNGIHQSFLERVMTRIFWTIALVIALAAGAAACPVSLPEAHDEPCVAWMTHAPAHVVSKVLKSPVALSRILLVSDSAPLVPDAGRAIPPSAPVPPERRVYLQICSFLI